VDGNATVPFTDGAWRNMSEEIAVTRDEVVFTLNKEQ
jgi:hypothetical protein